MLKLNPFLGWRPPPTISILLYIYSLFLLVFLLLSYFWKQSYQRGKKSCKTSQKFKKIIFFCAKFAFLIDKNKWVLIQVWLFVLFCFWFKIRKGEVGFGCFLLICDIFWHNNHYGLFFEKFYFCFCFWVRWDIFKLKNQKYCWFLLLSDSSWSFTSEITKIKIKIPNFICFEHSFQRPTPSCLRSQKFHILAACQSSQQILYQCKWSIFHFTLKNFFPWFLWWMFDSLFFPRHKLQFVLVELWDGGKKP